MLTVATGLKQWLTTRIDGFKNLITAYGTSRDHGYQFDWSQEARLDKATLDSMYMQHPLAWKLIDLLPDNALREWIDIQDEEGEDTLKAECKRFRPVLCEALKMSRLHGGAAIYIEAPGDPETPINSKTMILGYHVFECNYIWPDNINRTLRHEHYVIQHFNGLSERVHKSRLIILQGIEAPRDWMLANNGWGESVLQRLNRPLIAYSIAHALVPNILKDFIRDVIKIQGLKDLAINSCEDDQRSFNDRLDAMFQAESTLNKTVLDSEDEFISQTRSIAGLNDLIRNPEKWLCAASGIPHTLLFGESPGAALSQSGSSQEKDWNKTVCAYQEDTIRPALEQLFFILTGREVEFRFNPLDVPSQKEQAETFKLISEAVKVWIEYAGLTPDEALSMIKGDELKMLPVLDMETREIMKGVNYAPQSESQTPSTAP